MNFSQFCRPFYRTDKQTSALKGKASQPAIAEYFLSIALGERAATELVFSEVTFRKWFSGERDLRPDLWGTVSMRLDEKAFSAALYETVNENALPDLLAAFGIPRTEGNAPDRHAFSIALAKQFKAIADGNGEARDAVAEIYQKALIVADFPDYVKNAQAKYSGMKTLLYSTEERRFDDFFVCNTVSTGNTRSGRVPAESRIENATPRKLLEKSGYVLLAGIGGIGKSMMMRHLFLTAIREYAATDRFPVFVTLREFGSGSTDLMQLLVDSVRRFDLSFTAAHLEKILGEGRCILLLDGLDEIKAADMDGFLKQLDALMDRYPQNQYVMSTRKFSAFVELSRFTLLFLMPFSKEQALELIDKLEYYPEEPRLKQEFRKKLETEYYDTHREFVTNPLLLTLMLMNFRRFSDVPEKKYLFYAQAYETLLRRHDSDKLAYRRVFRSVTDPSDFTVVFREFCAKSYRKGDYEFDRIKFSAYFEKLNAVKRLDSEMMKADNFLFDICHSACLMFEEGQNYYFLHRSFQEYFFADYYSRQDDRTLIRLGQSIDKPGQSKFDEGAAFLMLYDLAPDKVERFILLPYLEKIFSVPSDRDAYWTFLQNGFTSWTFILTDEDKVRKVKEEHSSLTFVPYLKDRTYCELSSQIMALIFKRLHMDNVLWIEQYAEQLRGCRPENLAAYKIYCELKISPDGKNAIMPPVPIPCNVPEEEQERIRQGYQHRLIRDENRQLIQFGTAYTFHFRSGIEEAEKYPELTAVFDRPDCPARKMYADVKGFYQSLKEKYALADVADDDDF